MRHPFKRYCFFLAEKLGKTLTEVMSLSSTEISEWMAFDLTNNENWQEEYKKQAEIARQRSLDNEEKAKLFQQLFGGVRK